MVPGCIGKSNTNNLPAPTDLTENPYGKKKLFFKDPTQKSASVVVEGIAVELQPRRPIFEKCSHLREKGGVLTLRTPVGFVLTHTVGPFFPENRTKISSENKFCSTSLNAFPGPAYRCVHSTRVLY